MALAGEQDNVQIFGVGIPRDAPSTFTVKTSTRAMIDRLRRQRSTPIGVLLFNWVDVSVRVRGQVEKPSGRQRPGRTSKDALKLSLGFFGVTYHYDRVRELVTDDPIDIQQLETVLRKGLDAVKLVRRLKPGKKFEVYLDYYDSLFKDLLRQIVGHQH